MHKQACEASIEMEAEFEAEKKKAVREAVQKFNTRGSPPPPRAQTVIVFALIGLLLCRIIILAVPVFLPQSSEVVGDFSKDGFEDEACFKDDLEDAFSSSEYDSELDPCYTDLIDLFVCLLLPEVLQSESGYSRSYADINSAWANLSVDKKDAFRCAQNGIRWFYDDYGMDTIRDDICSGEFGTEEEVCSELMKLKECIEEADVCKSEALALLKCRDWKDGGCGCSW
jgi:hypothetical protein